MNESMIEMNHLMIQNQWYDDLSQQMNGCRRRIYDYD